MLPRSTIALIALIALAVATCISVELALRQARDNTTPTIGTHP